MYLQCDCSWFDASFVNSDRNYNKYGNQGCGAGGFWVQSESDFLVRLRLWRFNWIDFLHHTPKLGIPVEIVQLLM